MADAVLSLAEILTLEEMRALFECNLSPEIIMKKFLEDPRIKKMEYKTEENRFYITFDDGEISYFRILIPQGKNDA